MMRNSSKKSQNKKFSLFCCFSTCGGKKRRDKKFSKVSSVENKTNISRVDSSIKVNPFPQINNFKYDKKLNEDNNINNNKSYSNINEDKKSNKNLNKSNNDINNSNNIKSNLKKSNHNIKFNNINSIIHNNSIVISENLKQSSINNNNNIDKDMTVNMNIDENNNNYFLDNNDFIENKKNANKEEIITSKISNENISIKIVNSLKDNFKNNINQIYNKSNNSNIFLSNSEKNEQKNNLNNYEYENKNIYDKNNSSFNEINKSNQIKINEKENFISNNNEILSPKKSNIIFKHKQNDSNENSKNKTDSIIINNDDDNDFCINLNLDKYNKNASISIPFNNFKLNLSTIRNKENIHTNINTKPSNLNKHNINISDINPIFQNNSKKIKYSNSLKLIKINKFERSDILIDIDNKTGYFVTKIDEDNNIRYNFSYKKNKKNLKDENNIKIDKEKSIIFNYQSNSDINKYNNQNINSEIPLSKVEKELNYINDGDYFGEKKEIINENENEDENKNNQDLKIKEDSKILLSKIPLVEESNKNNIENNNIIDDNNEINKEENEKIKEEEQNIKDFEGEIEDEKDYLEEENDHINDSKSIISNIIATPLLGIQDMRSFAPSLYSKSEFKDNISNLNDLASNKGGFSIPHGIIDTEIEIMNENGNECKSFIETPRASGAYNKRFTHNNINHNTINNSNNLKYSNSSSRKMKSFYEYIDSTTKEIEKINERINKIDSKIKNYEECNKKYELLIEKEEEESEILVNMLNFLNESKK